MSRSQAELVVDTQTQERWMRLISLLNTDRFGYPCAWFEDACGNQLPTMANRIPLAQYVPENAQRMRIDGRVWVRDDWVEVDLQCILDRLQSDPEYHFANRNESLFVWLADRSVR